MTEIKRIAIDTSKSVFTLHGIDAEGRPVLRRTLRRQEVVGFFEALPPTEVALEVCGGSHHWGRTLQALGHGVRLIPPQYVKPLVKRGKNDRNDAEAISEAPASARERQVAVKSAGQQAQAMLLTVRELLIVQRTQLVNAVRGHAAEFGWSRRLARVAQLRADAASDRCCQSGDTPWRCSGGRSTGSRRGWPRSTPGLPHNTRRRRQARCWRRFRVSGRSVP